MHKRLTLAAGLTAAGLLAVPSLASADSSCTFDTARHQADVQLANPHFGARTRIERSVGGSIRITDEGGITSFCQAPDGSNTFANVTNIDRIRVTGSPNFEHVVINESEGQFAPGAGFTSQTGNRRVGIQLLTGTGGDIFEVDGTGFADAYSASGSALGGQVDMDNDGDTDAVMTAPARIILNGGFGNDRLAAMSVFGSLANLPVTLDGSEGADTLFGGNAGDLMLGGNGDDFVNSIGGGADVVAGLAGFDTAFVDPADTVSSVESKTVKVGALSGSKKTIEATAGRETSLSLAWTHPKAWKQLKSIKATMFDGAKAIGTIALTPAGKVSATGKVSLGTSKIGHHGKTVTAKLGFKVAPSLKGRLLSVDISATDKAGRTQTENAARSIALR